MKFREVPEAAAFATLWAVACCIEWVCRVIEGCRGNPTPEDDSDSLS